MAKLATSGYIRELIVIAPSLKEQEEMAKESINGIEKRTRTIQVVVDYWVTTDERAWESESDAKRHQMILDGKAKECSDCHGRGKIMTDYNRGRVGYGQYFQRCKTCDGIGIVIIEDIK